MKRRETTWFTLLVVLVLAAAACSTGSDDESTTDEAVDDASFDDRFGDSTDDAEAERSDDAGRVDAEGDLARTESTVAATSDDEAMEESDAMEDDGAEDAEAPTVASASSDEEDAAEGGFFGEEPAPEPRPDDVFDDAGIRRFVATADDPLSTFALDVDTASYGIGRSYVAEGALPPAASVRLEEYVNAFDYDYRDPSEGLGLVADGGPSPFDDEREILRIGVAAEEVSVDRDVALTFVIDTSGSMRERDRLEIVQDSLLRLVEQLGPDDTVAVVTFGGRTDVLLEPTSARELAVIDEVVGSLEPGGGTNLADGLDLGFAIADEFWMRDGVNRVVLISDGLANDGTTDPARVAEQVRPFVDRDIQLVTLGVGLGQLNDSMLETLADRGDGFYGYVNDRDEADEFFGERLAQALAPVAFDAKIQVDFDERSVREYRLLGFENRAVLDSDFRNDGVDAGELSSGHEVTAVYELVLERGVAGADPLATVSLRWEDPEERSVRETRLEVTASALADRWSDTDVTVRQAVTVAAFAEVLRDSPHVGDVTLDQVAAEAEALADELRTRDADDFADLTADAARL